MWGYLSPEIATINSSEKIIREKLIIPSEYLNEIVEGKYTNMINYIQNLPVGHKLYQASIIEIDN